MSYLLKPFEKTRIYLQKIKRRLPRRVFSSQTGLFAQAALPLTCNNVSCQSIVFADPPAVGNDVSGTGRISGYIVLL